MSNERPAYHILAAEQCETAAAVIDHARTHGNQVSRSQLERRHRAEILPRPTQMVRSDGRGTVTLYPTGTKELLVTSLAFEPRYRSLDRVLWEMWLDGQPVPLDGIRAQLGSVARFHDRIGGFLRRLGFGRPLLPDKALRLVERVTPHYNDRGLPPVRARLKSEADMQTFVRIMAEVLSGSYSPLPPSRVGGTSDDEGLLVERALGLDKTELEEGLPRVLVGNTAEQLAKGARLAGGSWSAALSSATDRELRQAKDRWVRFRRPFPIVVEEAREIFGGSAYGLWPLARLARADDYLTSAVAVFIMLRLGRSSDVSLRNDWDKLIAATEKWIDSSSPWLPAFRVFREVPALSDLLSPKSLRRSMHGPEAQQRLNGKILEAATAHEGEIIAALARAGVTLPVVREAPPIS